MNATLELSPRVRIGLMIGIFIMIIFIAFKADIQLWLVRAIPSKELLMGSPGSAAIALSDYDTARLIPDLYN